ncbi:hypothetical protein L1887_13060 [Cichorium endivia]|nr:hypothetical protein L1887_13060 [Cichorium endivia]
MYHRIGEDVLDIVGSDEDVLAIVGSGSKILKWLPIITRRKHIGKRLHSKYQNARHLNLPKSVAISSIRQELPRLSMDSLIPLSEQISVDSRFFLLIFVYALLLLSILTDEIMKVGFLTGHGGIELLVLKNKLEKKIYKYSEAPKFAA